MAEAEANWRCRNAPTCCQGTFLALGDASRELGPHQPTQTVPQEAHLSQPFPQTELAVTCLSIWAPGLKRAQVLSGPAGPTASSPATFCPFLLLTKRGCPDVLGIWPSSVWCGGRLSLPAPCSMCSGSCGCGVPPPRGKCYLRSGRTCRPKCPPSTWRSHRNQHQGPFLLGSRKGDSRHMAGWGRRGAKSGGLKRQVCAAGNAPPEGTPSETPGHFTTNCYILILY